MKIRKGTIKDVEKIWDLEVESRKYHKKLTDKKYLLLTKNNIDKKARSEFIKEYRNDLKKKSRKIIFLVAEEKTQIIGYIVGIDGKWGWSDNPPKAIRIWDLEVLKKYRKKGIGTRLIKELEKISKKRGAKFLSLNIWKKNKPALKVYKNNKFDLFSYEMVKKIK